VRALVVPFVASGIARIPKRAGKLPDVAIEAVTPGGNDPSAWRGAPAARAPAVSERFVVSPVYNRRVTIVTAESSASVTASPAEALALTDAFVVFTLDRATSRTIALPASMSSPAATTPP